MAAAAAVAALGAPAASGSGFSRVALRNRSPELKRVVHKPRLLRVDAASSSAYDRAESIYQPFQEMERLMQRQLEMVHEMERSMRFPFEPMDRFYPDVRRFSEPQTPQDLGQSSRVTRERIFERPYKGWQYEDNRTHYGRNSYSHSYTRITVIGASPAPPPFPQAQAQMLPDWLGVFGLVAAVLYTAVAIRFAKHINRTAYAAAERLKLALAWPFLLVFSSKFRKEFRNAVLGTNKQPKSELMSVE
eukprot:jgi/Chlat1/4095/Chrsp26S04144